MVYILEVTLFDTSDVLRIFNAARKQMKYLPSLYTDDETTEFIYSLVKEGGVWVAKIKGVAAGFIHFKNGWVNHLYIDPNFQNKGIGQALLNKAKRTNPGGLRLWVFEENVGAISFYEREGFKIAEKRDKKAADNEENLADRKYVWAP